MSFMGSFDFPQEGLAAALPTLENHPRSAVCPRHPTKRAVATKANRFDATCVDHFNIFAENTDAAESTLIGPAPSTDHVASHAANDPIRLALLDKRRSRLKSILDTATMRKQAVIEYDNRCMVDLRTNFWVEEEESGPSSALRLSVHAINFSVACVSLPVGAMMVTYSFLRGEDMRFTSRLSTLSSLALVAFQSNPGVANALGM